MTAKTETRAVTVAATAAAAPVTPDLSPKAGTAGYARSLKLTLNVSANPKRGASSERFALYADCATVGDYYDACKAAGISPGKTTADLKWDTDVTRKFVTLG